MSEFRSCTWGFFSGTKCCLESSTAACQSLWATREGKIHCLLLRDNSVNKVFCIADCAWPLPGYLLFDLIALGRKKAIVMKFSRERIHSCSFRTVHMAALPWSWGWRRNPLGPWPCKRLTGLSQRPVLARQELMQVNPLCVLGYAPDIVKCLNCCESSQSAK